MEDDEIVIAEPIEFESSRALLKDASKPVLQSVVRVLRERPDIHLVEVQGHTNVRESDIRNFALSGLRMTIVKQYLIDHGVDSSRLEAKGYGYTQPIEDDVGCLVPEKELTPKCREAMSKNRRVIFLLKAIGPMRPKPIAEGEAESASVLPTGKEQIPKGILVLPTCKVGGPSESCVLPTQDGVLKKDTVLGKPNTILPNESSLPSGGNILPKGGSNLPQR